MVRVPFVIISLKESQYQLLIYHADQRTEGGPL